jgi:methyl coenzyme M reductase subunit C
MKHELLISADFLNTVQIIINTRIVINASKPIPEDREVREFGQLSLEPDEVNSIDICTKC